MSKLKLKNDANHLKEGGSDFSQMIDSGLSRRRFMQGGAAAMGLFLAVNPLAQAIAAASQPTSQLLGFTALPISTSDDFIVPKGYIAKPLISWGDPILNGAPAFDESGTQSSAAQAGQFGDKADGKLPVVKMTKAEVMKFKNGTQTSFPILEVVDWVERPFPLEAKLGNTVANEEPEF